MPNIYQLVAELDEKRERAGKEHHDILSSGYLAYAIAIIDAYPTLRAHALAGAKLAEAVEKMECETMFGPNFQKDQSGTRHGVLLKQRAAALSAYREATK